MYHRDMVKQQKPEAYEHLTAIPAKTWVSCACSKKVVWDQTTSDTFKSANNMIGAEVDELLFELQSWGLTNNVVA